ncbi:MAG: diguanylate cyclase [Pseudomonadales bacterium]|nr:diguanylate cyclase [Pseudomonadales bacterium]
MDIIHRIKYSMMGNIAHLLKHRYWICCCILLLGLQGLANYLGGEFKPREDWDWADILGEGLAHILVFSWFLLILSIRSAGRVTNLFALGLIGIMISTQQDLLDEFIELPDGVLWDSWLESFPVGLVIFTAAVYLWREEQNQINRFMAKRELAFRSDKRSRSALGLSDYSGFYDQLSSYIKRYPEQWQQSSIAFIQVDPFSNIVREYSPGMVDCLLSSICELLLLGIRKQDLACHYQDGCFAIFLEGLQGEQAKHRVEKLSHAISAFPVDLGGSDRIEGTLGGRTISFSCSDISGFDLDALLQEARKALVAQSLEVPQSGSENASS